MFEINENTDFEKGQVILINKPLLWTSFDIVKKIRTLIERKLGYRKIKVGHSGTLDPLAEGLIIICTGKATKEISKFQAMEKEYIATMALGKTTPSFDLETRIDNEYKIDHITKDFFKQTIKNFIGIISQVPPLFSAKKFNGNRAYNLAREGKKFELKSNRIEIKEIEIIKYNLPVVILRIVCSKGTYVRALARDIGFSLKSGAHIIGLKRTSIGNYKLSDAITIEEFGKKLKIL